jgi:hypothetical protein
VACSFQIFECNFSVTIPEILTTKCMQRAINVSQKTFLWGGVNKRIVAEDLYWLILLYMFTYFEHNAAIKYPILIFYHCLFSLPRSMIPQVCQFVFTVAINNGAISGWLNDYEFRRQIQQKTLRLISAIYNYINKYNVQNRNKDI